MVGTDGDVVLSVTPGEVVVSLCIELVTELSVGVVFTEVVLLDEVVLLSGVALEGAAGLTVLN